MYDIKEAELICCNITKAEDIYSCNDRNYNEPNKVGDFLVTGVIIENSPLLDGQFSLGSLFTKFNIEVKVRIHHDENDF